MSDTGSPTPAEESLSALLRRLGVPGESPPRPVVRGPAGELFSFPVPEGSGRLQWRGVFREGGSVLLIGPVPASRAFSESQGLAGRSAEVADTAAEATQMYLERAEELDTELARVQQRGRTARLSEIWELGRRAARLRGHIGRALVALAALERLPESALPGLAAALGSVQAELVRVQEVSRAVQQGITDLILLRNAEEANRLGETTNRLGQISNRIAELQNISNIRMLGITLIALVLAIVGGVVLIPNTGATILGMPSAAWVPGPYVDLIMAVLIIVPTAYVFSRRWVRELLRGFSVYEFRAREGMSDLPEQVAGAGEGVATRSTEAAREIPPKPL